MQENILEKFMKKNNFWKEKKVLLTGIHGFIGSNLSKHLINNGAIVYGLTKNNSTYSLLSLERINNYNLINASGQPSDIFELINDKDIEICFHLGAQVEVQKAIQFPYDTLNNNINSTLQLCEAFRNSNHLKCFLFTSTDKVYGDIDKDKLPYKEDYTPLAKHPYEVSKLICENICKNYSENFKLPLIITRSCNLYGPGQLNFSALIPSLIKSAITSEEFLPRSNGLLLRDYMFIDDWVDTLKNIVEISINKNKFNEIYNFGTNNPYSVKEISKIIFDKINSKMTQKIINEFEKYTSQNEILYQSLNSEKAKRDFNFSCKTDISSGLDKTIDWYKRYLF